MASLFLNYVRLPILQWFPKIRTTPKANLDRVRGQTCAVAEHEPMVSGASNIDRTMQVSSLAPFRSRQSSVLLQRLACLAPETIGLSGCVESELLEDRELDFFLPEDLEAAEAWFRRMEDLSCRCDSDSFHSRGPPKMTCGDENCVPRFSIMLE